jgi:hypothetical protein
LGGNKIDVFLPRKTPTTTSTAAQLRLLRRDLRELKRLVHEQASAIQRNRRDHELTFQRMAQLQAEVDEIKCAWAKLTTRRG